MRIRLKELRRTRKRSELRHKMRHKPAAAASPAREAVKSKGKN